jgi:mRNA interferase RelE/StbE
VIVVFRRAAEKALDRTPADLQRQILQQIKEVAADPWSRSISVKPLAGSHLFRLRVGDYRVLYSLDEAMGILMVELIRTRGDVYRR